MNIQRVSATVSALDPGGNPIVCGTTESSDFPTVRALQPAHGGTRDGFVTKFDAAGSNVLFSTYFGRAAGDSFRACAVDKEGNIYLGGASRSFDFPLVNPAQLLKDVWYDVVVVKLDPSASEILFSTFWGGLGLEGVRDMQVDEAGNTYLVGTTTSVDFPLVDPYQSEPGGDIDGFVAKLTPSGSAFVFSTFLGGEADDSPLDWNMGIALGPLGSVYVTSSTASPDFPSVNGVEPPQAGDFDAWVAKFGPGPELDLNVTGSAAEPLVSARLSNPGPNAVDVEVKLWVDSPSLELHAPIPTGVDDVLTAEAGSEMILFTDVPVEHDGELPFPGTTIGIRIVDPASGDVLSERLCPWLPCGDSPVSGARSRKRARGPVLVLCLLGALHGEAREGPTHGFGRTQVAFEANRGQVPAPVSILRPTKRVSRRTGRGPAPPSSREPAGDPLPCGWSSPACPAPWSFQGRTLSAATPTIFSMTIPEAGSRTCRDSGGFATRTCIRVSTPSSTTMTGKSSSISTSRRTRILVPSSSPSKVRIASSSRRRECCICTFPTSSSGCSAPRTLQASPAGAQRTVESRFVIDDDGKVSVELGDYDTSLPLTIDPVIAYTTYFGAEGFGRRSRHCRR